MPVNTGYGQGTSFTNASGPSGMDISPYLRALIANEQKFMQQRANGGMTPPANVLGGMRTTVQRLAPAPEGERAAGQAQQKIMNAKAQMAEAEAAAMTGKAPMRGSFVGGQYVVTPDSNAMSGFQRKAHLPNESGMIGSEGPDPRDLLFYRQMMEARQRSAEGEGVMSLSGRPGAQPVYYGGGR